MANKSESKMSEEALMKVIARNADANLARKVSTDLQDGTLLSAAKEQRKEWRKLSDFKNMRQYLLVPRSVEVVAERVLGRDCLKRSNKNFKKFLAMDFWVNGQSVKGEAFLTVPKDKL